MSSFSLPSAGGVVSLLNDVQPIKISVDKGDLQMRPTLLERHSSGSSSAVSLLSNRFDDSTDTGGKDSLSSTFSSINGGSSTNGSIDNGRIAEIHSLRKKMEDQSVKSEDSQQRVKREASENRETNMDDDKIARPVKRRRSKEVKGRPAYTRSRSSHAEKVLPDQTRLASSPLPLDSSYSSTEDSKDVPMSMHKATSMSEEDLDREKAASSSKSATSSNAEAAVEVNEMAKPPSGKRRYPCSYPNCDKTFSTSGHAARHNRIHTGSKPYRCTFPGCNASFSRQDNSLQHYRTHVLHPKSRSSGVGASTERALSVEGRGGSASSADGHSGLDPGIKATVLMGRKALEEGTAIAVVHEVVDGNGHRGEAIQRMVGQPKSSRRGSSATAMPESKERESLQRSRACEEAEDDDDSMSVGTSWSYNNPHYSYSHLQHQQSHPHYQQLPLPPPPPPPAAPPIHNEYSSYPSHHPTSMTYPPAGHTPARSAIGAYSTAPHYRTHSGYKHGSPTYFNGHDYYPSKSFNGHFDPDRRGSASGLTYMSQSEASRAATAAARRFYTATNPHNDLAPRSPSIIDPIDHKRAHSFGTAQRPQLQSDRQGAWSVSPPMLGGAKHEANEIWLPPPSVSAVPYSSDRSTSDRLPTTPRPLLDDSSSSFSHHKATHSTPDANGSSAYQNDRRTLAPLRGVLRK